MDERTFEDIICKYPELIEDNLSFKGRQVIVNGKRVDLLFGDRHGQKLIIELKKGAIQRKHTAQIFDYEGEYITPDDPTVRVMLVGNRVPENIRRSLDHHGFEWKEITIMFLINFLREKGDSGLLGHITSEVTLLPDIHDTGSSLKPIKTGLSTERKRGPDIKKVLSEKEKRRYEFLQKLLFICRQNTNLFNNVSPKSYDDWVETTSGKSGLKWQFTVREKYARVEFWLVASAGTNLKRYGFIINHKDDIEKKFGEPLIWDLKENRKNQCIRYYYARGGFEEESSWDTVIEDLIGILKKMESSLRDIINRLE